ncbi:hypothetical protein OAE49_06255 [Gammaproteobacteria bacterium]|nr:hypothetical protein [Gammaproteobacteria bacterium]
MSYTYAQLKTVIQDYTENTETSFVTNLPNFIKNAEQRIFKLVDLEVFRRNATSSLSQNDPYLSVPTDYLASFSLSITNSGSKEFLLQKDVNFLQEFHPNSSTTGTPKYYAFFDIDNFIIAPTPDSNYTVELHYYYLPASITAGSDSGVTWLSDNAPNALLYGSLVEAYTYMKGEPDLLALYEKQFNEALSRIKDLAEARENSDAYRRGLPERPRT